VEDVIIELIGTAGLLKNPEGIFSANAEKAAQIITTN
jgi:hypothetical protein